MGALALTPIMDSLFATDTDWEGIPQELVDQAIEYQRRSHAPGTKRCYEGHLRRWCVFCGGQEKAFPVTEPRLLAFMAELHSCGLSPYTIRNYLITLASVHRAKGWGSIYSYKVNSLQRAYNQDGVRTNRKRPLRQEHRVSIAKVLSRSDNRLQACRDRAILWLGWCGALRRSELEKACVDQFEFTDEGMVFYIRSSKGDQYGNGQAVHIRRDARLELCPVVALQNWLRMAKIKRGPIFRKISAQGMIGTTALTGDAIGDLVCKYVDLIGLDPDFYGGHSLRRGRATYDFEHGASLTSIQRHLRHSSLKYTREYVDGPTPGDRNLSRSAGV